MLFATHCGTTVHRCPRERRYFIGFLARWCTAKFSSRISVLNAAHIEIASLFSLPPGLSMPVSSRPKPAPGNQGDVHSRPHWRMTARSSGFSAAGSFLNRPAVTVAPRAPRCSRRRAHSTGVSHDHAHAWPSRAAYRARQDHALARSREAGLTSAITGPIVRGCRALANRRDLS